MRRNETTGRNAVAIEEDEVVAIARRDRAIADFGEAKAPILLPDVLEGNTGLLRPGTHQIAGLRSRPVIRNHDLKISIRLPRE